MSLRNLVRYPAFRRWQEAHEGANNVHVALQLGVAMILRRVEEQPGVGPWMRMPDVIPELPAANSFDTKLSDAVNQLRRADHDLSFLAIPQIMAIFHELLVQSMLLCEDSNAIAKRTRKQQGEASQPVYDPPGSWKASDLQKRARFGGERNATDECLELALALRNAIAHGAGRGDERVDKLWRHLSPKAKTRWISLAGREPSSSPKPLLLGWGETKAVLAICKESAVTLNRRLAEHAVNPDLPKPHVLLTKEDWAAVALRDYQAQSVRRARRHTHEQQVRRLVSHAKTHYAPVALQEAHFQAVLEADALGH